MAKQTLAIIGAAGNMGSVLARSLAKGSYRLLLIGKDIERLKALEDELRTTQPHADVEAMSCARDGCWEADIVLPAVPYEAQGDIAEKIRPVTMQKTVISIINPLNAAFDALVTPPGTSAAEELQALMPDARVVKAFNTCFAGAFPPPELPAIPADSFLAGDNEEALQTASELVAVAGFRPLIAGSLTYSRILEQMSMLLLALNHRYGWKGKAAYQILNS